MMKKLLAIGTLIGTAAYLRNKDRRDRLMSRSRGVIDDLKQKAQHARERAAQRKASQTGSEEPLFNESELAGQTTSPGYRSPPPPRGNGIY
jgi:hypothetical protein